jgi:hypothetical protein
MIFQEIQNHDKHIYDVDQLSEIPSADVYFIGFGIRNNSCSIEIIDLLEKMENQNYALFLTCGNHPTEQYKQNLKRYLEVWLPENGVLLDTMICQGRAEESYREMMYQKYPDLEEKFRQMFELGSSHPDGEDLKEAAVFTRNVQLKIRR